MSLILFHALSMGLAFLCMLMAIVSARFFKTKKWWLKIHRILNTFAVILAVMGFLFAFFMVSSTGGPHIRVPHALLGIATLAFLLTMPFLGMAIFKLKDKNTIAKLKKAHRALGRLTALMLAITIVAGMRLAGIF